MSDDPVIRDAVRLRDRLADVAKELRIREKTERGAKSELAGMDATTCEQAAEMMETLGTEVSRLRAGIGCYHYGRLERSDLFRMTQSWNGNSKKAPPR